MWVNLSRYIVEPLPYFSFYIDWDKVAKESGLKSGDDAKNLFYRVVQTAQTNKKGVDFEEDTK